MSRWDIRLQDGLSPLPHDQCPGARAAEPSLRVLGCVRGQSGAAFRGDEGVTSTFKN